MARIVLPDGSIIELSVEELIKFMREYQKIMKETKSPSSKGAVV